MNDPRCPIYGAEHFYSSSGPNRDGSGWKICLCSHLVITPNPPIAADVQAFIEREGNYTPTDAGVYGKLGRAIAGWRGAAQERDALREAFAGRPGPRET